MKIIKDIIIGLLCGILFLILIFWYDINIITSILVTLFIFSVFNLIFNRNSSRDINIDINLEGYKTEALTNFIKDNEKKIGIIRNSLINLEGNIKIKLEVICKISEDIIKNLIKKPQSIDAVKKVFSLYLETVYKVLDTYKQLSDQNLTSKQVQIRLKKIENILDELIIIFNKYKEVSIEKQLLHLDNEIMLLEQIIRTEV